jgi:hypothetical protein
MEDLTIKGELLFEFKSMSQWVNKASSWFKPYKYGFAYICLDKNGNVCHQGEDFMNAEAKDLFPVKVYALQRACQPEIKADCRPDPLSQGLGVKLPAIF